MVRSSVSSLVASAAMESAWAMSTSSWSLHFSVKAFFHSSTNGPRDVSFDRTPTFFCSPAQSVASSRGIVDRYRASYPCGLDHIGDLGKEGLVLGSVLAAHENLDGEEAAALDLVEVLGWSAVSARPHTCVQ